MIMDLLIAALFVTPVPADRTEFEPHAPGFQSPARTYRAEVEYEMRLTDFVPFSRFALYDAAGRMLYSRPGEGITMLDIADNGIVVGAEFDGPVSGRTRLRFFATTGTEIGTAEIGFYGPREFSRDGSVFCVLDGREGVRVFTAAGQELYNLGPANRFAVSADVHRVELARDDALVLFRDGDEQGRVALPTPFVRELRFSADGGRVGYVERHGLRVYRTDDLAELMTWRPAAVEPEPVTLDISDDGLALVGLGKAHGRHVAVLLDAAGTELWRNEAVSEHWNASTPKVRFGADRTLRIETVEDIAVFRYEEER